jgi:hypothetical protein
LSEIRANTISDAAGTGPIDLHKQSAAKAWLDMPSGFTQINNSLNVASIADLGVGMCEVNFSSVMSSVAYSFAGSVSQGGVSGGVMSSDPVSSSKYRNDTVNVAVNSTFEDRASRSSVHGDLA